MKRVAFFAFLVFSLLPCQLPAEMRTVEEQFEDTPHDMRCYTDADGNTYDFAFVIARGPDEGADVVIRLAGAGSNGCN
jgi:hypothetical protein